MVPEVKQVLSMDVQRLYKLNEEGKNPFLRQTKFFEETSELAEAVICNHQPEKILGEAIDGLLMLISIAADYLDEREFVDTVPNWINDKFEQSAVAATNSIPAHFAGMLPYATLQYIAQLQYISTAVQKVEGVASSQYKGTATTHDVITHIMVSLATLMHVFVLTGATYESGDIQRIYDTKMDKWEKVAK